MTERRDDEEAFAATVAPDDPALARTMASTDPAFARTMAASGPADVQSGPRDPSTLTAEHSGRYERKEEIGRGGMGRVVLVRDTHLGRDVALKELLSQGSPEEGVSVGSATRFLREARITGQLEHPGIVPVHELGQRADGTIYYTMKRIRGRSLASALADAKTLKERLALMRTFRDVCEAMAYAHSRGVVHRDLKPDNIMVGEFGDTLVVDWGLAKVKGERDPAQPTKRKHRASLVANESEGQTIDGAAMGTPSYMSPEQARGDVLAIDERTDVWGLGAILFEILTGRPPYVGKTTLEVLARVTDEPPPRVRDVCPEAPPELAAIADRSLMRDPSSRYPGAAEIAKEINAFQDGRIVSAYEYSGLDLLKRFVRRNRAASVAAASIAVLTVVASVLVYSSFLDEQRARGIAEDARDEAMDERSHAMTSAHEAEVAVAEALLDRAERALDSGDPTGAAVFAAGVLARTARMAGDSTAVDAESELRNVRAFSLFIEAEAARRYVFEQAVPGAHTGSALSTDGRTIAIPTGPAIRLVSLDGAPEIRAEVQATRVRGLDPHGVAVVVGDAPGIYDLHTGELLRATAAATGAAFASSGIAVASEDGTVVVMAPDGRTQLDTFTTEHRGSVRVALSADRLAVVAADAPTIDLWSWPRGSTSTPIALRALPHMTAFSPRGDRLAVMVADTALPMITLTPSVVLTELPMGGWPTAITWDSSGMIAAIEDNDRVALRDPTSGEEVDTLHLPASNGGRVESGGDRIAYFPLNDGSGSLAEAIVFHRAAGAGREEVAMPTAVRDLVVDPARSRIVVSSITTISSIAIDRRQRLGAVTELGTMPPGAGFFLRIAVGPDGSIAAITTRGALVLFEAPLYAAEVVRPAPASSTAQIAFLGIAFSRDGSEVFTGSPEGGRILRWSRADHAEARALEGHTEAVGALAVSADGLRLASGSTDGTARIWTLRTGTADHVVEGHDQRASGVAFSPDGARLATADGTGHVRIVDVATGHVTLTGAPHDRWINRIAWSPDGRWLVTAADDCSVRVLEPSDLRPTRIVRALAAPTAAEITPDAAHVVFHDGRRVLRLDLRLTMERPEPSTLLVQAEERAGVHLDGLMLSPR
jgi:serine/threonine protein kinase/WD40 repeat protein